MTTALDLPLAPPLKEQPAIHALALGPALRRRAACAPALAQGLALLALLALAAPAGAAPSAPAGVTQPPAAQPSAAQKETARTWLREGYEALERGDDGSALERFTGAYRLVRVPTTGLAVAHAQERLGQWVEANATAMEVLNMPRQPGEPEVFGQARDDARALSDRLSRRIPSLRFEVTPDGAAARVAIDGVEMHGATQGMPFKLNPGEHRLQVSAPGYLPAERSLVLRENTHERLTVELAPEPYAPPTQTAASTPAAAPTRAAVPAAPAAPPPAHPLAADDTSGSGARTRGWVGLGVAGAAALVGSVTGVLAFSSKPDCPDNRCTPDQKDEADSSRLYGNVASVSFGVAAVAGAYALWELLANAPSRPRAPDVARASLVPSRSGALLEVSGSF